MNFFSIVLVGVFNIVIVSCVPDGIVPNLIFVVGLTTFVIHENGFVFAIVISLIFLLINFPLGNLTPFLNISIIGLEGFFIASLKKSTFILGSFIFLTGTNFP